MLSTMVSLGKKLSKNLSYGLVFIILACIFYFFGDWLKIAISPEPSGIEALENNSKDSPASSETISYDDIIQFAKQVAAYTDRYGVVEENNFSDHVKQLICSHRRYWDWYMQYRQPIWHKKQANRLETSDGQFDSGDYSPSFSSLVENAPTEDHSE